MVDEKKYYYSEIFHSIQGEGEYTGTPTAWIRFFLCNLQCSGFGQKDPTDPSTYELPFEDFDVDSVKRVETYPCGKKAVIPVTLGQRSSRNLWDTKLPQYLQIKL